MKTTTDASACSFDNIYRHNMLRIAVGIPHVALSHPAENAKRIIDLSQQAHDQHAAVALFPELSLTGYSNDDLFLQQPMHRATLAALQTLVDASLQLNPVIVVGAPLVFEHKLFNCAVVIYQGRILGATPKSYLPNYREFYEKRQFAAARDALQNEYDLLGQRVPFGNQLLFAATNLPDFVLHAEICEDLWTPTPPSSIAALAGATVLTNLSASNITIGKAAYRQDLAAAQSGRCVAAYAYAAAGPGESTTDLAWDGHAMVYECDAQLAESERFADHPQLITADIDLDRIRQSRLQLSSFADAAADQKPACQAMRRIEFTWQIPNDNVTLQRDVPRFPFVPNDSQQRDAHCHEAYNIQVHGLKQRLLSSGIRKLVIGISGGLDSTQALLVAVKTFDQLNWPRQDILAYTLPGFATSNDTKNQAWSLMQSLGVTAEEIDIRPSCQQMLEDLNHPFVDGKPEYDITFENVQAGERTSHLFRLANHHQALVLGTGDLSELALGWCTYGVGDHMSHYNVNASVPKTLIQHLIRWVAETLVFNDDTSHVLLAILASEISPELIPGETQQSTQATVGPYELQDFNIFYTTRYGYEPEKVAYLALHAWQTTERGQWPDGISENDKRAYDLNEIQRWLNVFLKRFFGQSQFKRSAMPNGPKVGSGGSLSPRGDWRAPSDNHADLWLKQS